MKLRNKKTGYVGDFNIEHVKERGDFLVLTRNDVPYYEVKVECGNLIYYDNLAELNEEWEYYKPTEPLIKDEKIRKAVRAWAEAVDVDKVIYQDISEYYVYFRTEIDEYEHTLCINFRHKLDADLCSGTTYTITELCGEEEEC